MLGEWERKWRSWTDSCCFVCHTEGCSKWTREKITLTSECQLEMGQPLWVLVNALRIYMIHIHLHIHIRLGNPAQPRAIQRHSCWAWIMGLSREVVVSICCSMGTLCVCWARVKTMCDTIWIFDYFSGVHTSCIIHQLIAPHLGLQKIEANRWGDQTIKLYIKRFLGTSI